MVNLKRTREDILASVLDLIHHQGFQSTGLKELFSVCGTSSGSFYNYFQSKDELAHALIDYKWQQIKTHIIEPAAEHTSDPIAQLVWIIDRLEAKHLTEPDCGGCFLGNLIVDLAKYDASFQTHLIQVFDQWHFAIAQLLRQGQTQLRSDIDPDNLAEQLMNAIEGTLLLGRLYNHPNRLQRGFDNVRQMLKAALKQ
ncbi:TetR/AcrR family transcriptional regulator [Chroococcidiopsis sp. FACHB-1243]|uniref:TetR/AcrR family transcriptional regulator n=1 Tax=Chroococcidiopsis sp. [FACHB-1243] TaxID=2692781 RepID=UPI0017817478|nr:TetR/AcrR family transcriptional regulator [Chroococcidiopsis sp. [FACHB-1243]]MBD2308094.1 TetR/AcrR family transcriptional regulator [Chroococcidiopsis sp. [FACHB-1243]]